MSQRWSEYRRQENDLYETPAWVTEALLPHLPGRIKSVWEPACGSGKMAAVLDANFKIVDASDISGGIDFLKADSPVMHDAIVTNPPFGLAEDFIKHGLGLMERRRGVVAMLLRSDYDHAATRKYLFGGCPQFCRKVALTKRIVWFERPGAAPSFNHAWFLWDWRHRGLPTLEYGP